MLRCPPLPAAVRYLWRTFLRLHNRRASGGFGASAIAWSDIQAFAALTRINLLPFEVEMIEALDDAWLREQARRGKADAPAGDDDSGADARRRQDG
ncbi:MAG: hypothetical protein AB7O45_12045 [Alphaproteobacteria bacterium]